jgi:hypothetical protein
MPLQHTREIDLLLAVVLSLLGVELLERRRHIVCVTRRRVDELCVYLRADSVLVDWSPLLYSLAPAGLLCDESVPILPVGPSIRQPHQAEKNGGSSLVPSENAEKRSCSNFETVAAITCTCYIFCE